MLFGRWEKEIDAQFYSEALKSGLEDPELEMRLHLARQDKDFPIGNSNGRVVDGQAAPINLDAIARVLQRMTNRDDPIYEDDITRAAELLEGVVYSPNPAQEVRDHLDEIDSILTALLELNIRQELVDGRFELAQALKNLRDNIFLQIGDSNKSESPTVMMSHPGRASKNINILFLYPASAEIPPRIALSAEALSSKGCGIRILSDPPKESMAEFNVVYVHNPHVDLEILEALAQFSACGATIVLDLYADYEQMPVEHPEYEKMGLSSLAKAKAYSMALLLADQICVPNYNFATLLQKTGYRVKVIPDGWSEKNDLWDKPSASRHTLNFGWIGLPCQIDDTAPVRRIVSRILREFPQVQFVIGGDPEVYRMFDSLPESRRLFLPNVSYEDYPYLVSQIDVLLSPLRNNPYNRTLTDRWIMEAGVRRIPWIASPLPSVVAWGAGGLIANTLEEWHTHLRQLVLDHSLRDSLGSSGRQRAEEREIGKLSDSWYQMIMDIWRKKQNN